LKTQQVKNKENNVIQAIQQMLNPNVETRNYLVSRRVSNGLLPINIFKYFKLKYYEDAQKIIEEDKNKYDFKLFKNFC
jgi:hypothetical protein